MNTIDKYQAPRECIAVAPDEFSSDGIGECRRCCFDSGGDATQSLIATYSDSKRHRNSPRSDDLWPR